MSASGIAVVLPRKERQQAPRPKHWLWALMERFSPSQGWLTFALLIVVLLVVGNTVREAHWVDTPGLVSVLVFGGAAGLLLAKVRAPAPLLHLAGLAIGFVVVVWQTSSLVKDRPLPDQVQEMWSRLKSFYDVATSGGINTDLLPVSLGILALAWLLGYASSWFIFRSNNVWVGLVLGGTATLTVLSFLPEKFATRFFVFIFFAMLLVVRMSIVQRHEAWRKAMIDFKPLSSWLTIHAALWFCVIVVILSAVLPLNVLVSRSMVRIWNTGRAPVERLEEEFARLFAAIPSRKNISGRFFGKTLPFLGKISFNGEVVLWAASDYPSYWLSQTYSEYTPQGWIAGQTKALEIGPSALPPQLGDTLKRVPVDQSVQLSFATSDFLVGGGLDAVSHSAVVETLSPKTFDINLLDPTKDSVLPPDVRQLAGELREKLKRPPSEFIEAYISQTLPSDLVLKSVTPGSEATDRSVLRTLTLERKEPVAPEVVSWKFAERLPANTPYAMLSFVSVATDSDLRQAGTDYPSFIEDHYLQLPSSLPERVSGLARQVTAEAKTPLDKSLAVQAYLRGPEFKYSQSITAPPSGSDGVDHFLFESKTGYSDYFASSMVVLLRAAGVPARLAAGYGPGERETESGRRYVRDTDSHAWAQVYFPKYGWIDYEPTPKWPVHLRRLLSESILEEISPREGALGGSDTEDIGDLSLEDRALENPAGGEAANIFANPRRLAIPFAIALGAVAFLGMISWLLWNIGLARATPVERAYTKMSRLGALAGVRRQTHQTPGEYAEALGHAVPEVRPSALRIAWSFASDRYSGREPLEEAEEKEKEELAQAWADVRGRLAAQALSRLIPVRAAQQ